MTNLDQFESTFKSADKARFSYESISLQKLLLVTDGNEEKGSEFRNNVEQMLTGATGIEGLELSLLLGDDFDKISTLLQLARARDLGEASLYFSGASRQIGRFICFCKIFRIWGGS